MIVAKNVLMTGTPATGKKTAIPSLGKVGTQAIPQYYSVTNCVNDTIQTVSRNERRLVLLGNPRQLIMAGFHTP